MAESYPCPRCGEDVPTHHVFSGPATSDPAGPGAAQFQHQWCPWCGAHLERATNIPDKSWRLDPKVHQQPPWDG